MTLKIYVPQDRAIALAKGETLPVNTSGTALFADISGFTPLTEKLRNAFGARRGAEVLASQLNAVYSALIAQVELFGGSVIDFAGDAMLCWFDEINGSAPLRAAACSVAMQAAMQSFGAIPLPDGQSGELVLKVAVATGPARRLVVGDPAYHYMDTLSGATISRTSDAEHIAKRGEIMMDRSTVEALGSNLVVREWRNNIENSSQYAVVERCSAEVPPVEVRSVPDLDEELLREWVHPITYRQETSGLGGFQTEFRPGVALFVRFIGIDFDSDEAEAQLNTFACRLQSLVSEAGGTMLQIIIGDKGSYAYVNFGGLSAHEDDVRRAAKAALKFQEEAQAWTFLEPLQMGIAYGVMRVGAYGGETRRTYGVLGDDVNLAARLMQTAEPGEILLSGQAQKAIMKEFVFEPRPPLVMKGKSEPMAVYALTGERVQRAIRLQEPQYALPMVGRQRELQIIEEKLELALEGKSQIIGIQAEAGMGKSRLVAEVIRLAHKKGFAGYGGACRSDAVNTAYHVWKPIWSALFDIDPAAPLRKQIRLLEGEIEDRAPERVESLPLVGEILNIDIPENDFTRVLEPKDRKGALSVLLETCLKSAAGEEPLLIVIEDMHWIDSLSHDLLETLAQTTSNFPICFVLAFRPPQLQRLKNPRVESLPQFTRIELNELTSKECEQAIRAKLAQLYPARSEAVPPILIDRLMDRAQGNPFYLEELINFLRDRGLDPLNPSDLEKIELPDSLHTLILSRIDQLSEREKTTLRVASIVGRLFRASWLTGYYPTLGSLPDVKADLKELDHLEITPLDSPEPELAYLFKHIVTHEVAYESLPFSTRAKMHEQLAEFLENNYPDENLLDVLTFHYSQSENIPKKREYLRKSAEAAYRAFSNEAAIEFYEQALSLTPDPGEQVDIHLRSGAILQEISEWDQSLSHYKTALEIAEKHQFTHKVIESQIKIGTWFERRGEYQEAVGWLDRVEALAATENSITGLCDTLVEQGCVHWRLGNFEKALEYCHRGLALAREAKDKKRESEALFMSANILGEKGDYPAAHQFFADSFAIDKELNDRRHLGANLLNWGTTYYYQGDYKTSRKFIEESLNAYREIGIRRGESIALSNLGNIYYLENDLKTARKYYEESYTLAHNLSDRYMMAISLSSMGITSFQEGSLDEAENYYQRAMALNQALGHKPSLALLYCYLGLLALAREQVENALNAFRQGVDISYESDIRIYVLYNLIGFACVFQATGDPSSAARILGAVAAHAQAIGFKMETELQQPFDKTRQAAKEVLGEDAFNAAWELGQKMSLDDAVVLSKKG